MDIDYVSIKLSFLLLKESSESLSCIVPRKAVIELQKILSTEKDIEY